MKHIYTRKGDDGETTLLLGGRVSKTDPRCEACGTLDEAVSALGLARALAREPRVRELTEEVQRDLSILITEIASNPSRREEFERRFHPVDASMTQRLEATIDSLSAQAGPFNDFVTPGSSAASAALDLARTILRRAERKAVALKEAGLLANSEVIRYLNRVSDLVFVLARYEDCQGGTEPGSQKAHSP